MYERKNDRSSILILMLKGERRKERGGRERERKRLQMARLGQIIAVCFPRTNGFTKDGERQRRRRKRRKDGEQVLRAAEAEENRLQAGEGKK